MNECKQIRMEPHRVYDEINWELNINTAEPESEREVDHLLIQLGVK